MRVNVRSLVDVAREIGRDLVRVPGLVVDHVRLEVRIRRQWRAQRAEALREMTERERARRFLLGLEGEEWELPRLVPCACGRDDWRSVPAPEGTHTLTRCEP